MAIESVDGLPYVVVRCYSAGVHVGYLKSREAPQTVTLIRSRRCWRYVGVGGTGSCTELSLHGPDPRESLIAEEVSEHTLLDAIEILPVTAAAKERLDRCTSDAE